MPTFAGNRRSLAYIVLSNNRTQNCATDRQTEEQNSDRHTYEIIYVRFRRYVCISFANFLLRKKYIAQLNYHYHQGNAGTILYPNNFISQP